MPEIFIIAGCNGAGKTTAAFTLLPSVFKTIEFVNADEIAKGLSPLNSESVAFQAGRIMLERISYLISENESFAFETTLSGLSYIEIIKSAKAKNYEITILYVFLENVELAKLRVANRVIKGGHNILQDIIERRYEKGLRNLPTYLALANDWYLYDNSDKEYSLVGKNTNGYKEISNFDIYKKIAKYGTL